MSAVFDSRHRSERIAELVAQFKASRARDLLKRASRLLVVLQPPKPPKPKPEAKPKPERKRAHTSVMENFPQPKPSPKPVHGPARGKSWWRPLPPSLVENLLPTEPKRPVAIKHGCGNVPVNLPERSDERDAVGKTGDVSSKSFVLMVERMSADETALCRADLYTPRFIQPENPVALSVRKPVDVVPELSPIGDTETDDFPEETLILTGRESSVYLPSLEDIAAECALIRAGWCDSEFKLRRRMMPHLELMEGGDE